MRRRCRALHDFFSLKILSGFPEAERAAGFGCSEIDPMGEKLMFMSVTGSVSIRNLVVSSILLLETFWLRGNANCALRTVRRLSVKEGTGAREGEIKEGDPSVVL